MHKNSKQTMTGHTPERSKTTRLALLLKAMAPGKSLSHHKTASKHTGTDQMPVDNAKG